MSMVVRAGEAAAEPDRSLLGWAECGGASGEPHGSRVPALGPDSPAEVRIHLVELWSLLISQTN